MLLPNTGSLLIFKLYLQLLELWIWLLMREILPFSPQLPAASGVAHHLESCSVVVRPELDVTNEHFAYPENLVKQLGLSVELSVNGINVVGNYSEILSLSFNYNVYGFHYSLFLEFIVRFCNISTPLNCLNTLELTKSLKVLDWSFSYSS